MFDHVGLHVSSLEVSREFYSAVLPTLGFSLLQDNEAGGSRWLVYGSEVDSPFFVVSCSPGRRVEPVHLAFSAPSAEAVDRFHAAGLSAGATDHGAPGPRPARSRYYAAYLLDPDGNNIEAGFRARSGSCG